jgi:steroid 5-alpha reductase family enzyme
LNGGDDPRYAHLKQQWGNKSRSKLFWFVQIQAAVAIPLVLSIGVAGHNPAQYLGIGNWTGIMVLSIAICGESIADRQLRNFIANPANKTKVCDVGLWSLSRHPNFFFEWFGWMAYPLIAVELNGSYPQGWIALAGPAVMYWLLVYVSGIPPLEAHMLRSRGDAFKSYQRRVNAFWPGRAKLSSQSLS